MTATATTTHMPERIGRFRLQSMLGRGAMGVVYKGHDEEIDRPVAIKLIRADLLDSAERESYFKRFRNEAKIAGRCVHANIVGLYDFSLHENNPYLVMEYVNGVGLQQAIPRGSQRPVEEVMPIALQVLDALQYAHERGIVHRDIKPANILLTPQSKLKITDFGISRLTSAEMTLTPLLIGTPSYMSPEQCMGSALDGRSDLFSLGCVVYELLAGQRPFTGSNYTDTILSIINKPHVPLSSLRDDLPQGLSEAIDRALAKRPEDRFADADAFSQALHDASNIRSPSPPPLAQTLKSVVAGHTSGLGHDSDETIVAPPLDPTLGTSGGTSGAYSSGDYRPAVSAPEEYQHYTHHETVEPAETPAYEAAPESEPSEAVFESEQGVSDWSAWEGDAEASAHVSETHTSVVQDQVIHTTDDIVDYASESVAETPIVVEPAVEQVSEPPTPAESFDEAGWQRCCEWTARCLTYVLGPIGPTVVARMAARSNSPLTLVSECAGFIRHQNERDEFLRLIGKGPADVRRTIGQAPTGGRREAS
ncbi:serine/threonine-protein kinase [Acetobacter sp. DsW_063]|uniref:serine/threonine-protein kinase n=1 Tax=Acetobacter sp. DsW_063 TaxID=1514894 RepID=UPI000A364B9D|nr:serine/threonine-protein kinase [Acetobacter sp. DsW_063]